MAKGLTMHTTSTHRGGQPRAAAFHTLTRIRQTGLVRTFDGAVTYSFAAVVHSDLPPVKITLQVTSGGDDLQITACFDDTLRETMREGEPA